MRVRSDGFDRTSDDRFTLDWGKLPEGAVTCCCSCSCELLAAPEALWPSLNIFTSRPSAHTVNETVSDVTRAPGPEHIVLAPEPKTLC